MAAENGRAIGALNPGLRAYSVREVSLPGIAEPVVDVSVAGKRALVPRPVVRELGPYHVAAAVAETPGGEVPQVLRNIEGPRVAGSLQPIR